VPATRTSAVHVPEHVSRTSELAVTADAAASLHTTVASRLHQNHITHTGTVDAEVLGLAVVCRHKTQSTNLYRVIITIITILPRDGMHSAALVIVICLSDCRSVCHMNSWIRELRPHGSTYDHDFFTA